MSHLSWNEVRDRAVGFVRRWDGTTSERAEKQTFWNEFFEVFGIRRASVASFEENVKNLKGNTSSIDLLWRGKLLVEHKSLGQSLDMAQVQAFGYIEDLTREGRFEDVPRFVLVSDFAQFVLYDLEPEEQQNLPLFAGQPISHITFTLNEFPKAIRHFAFMLGQTQVRLDPEDPANEKAYLRMCQLHDALLAGGFKGHELERLLVRILFCLFAEDTGIFPPDAFTQFVRTRTREDGSDLGQHLNHLFEILDTPAEERQAGLDDDLSAFPYVNGLLFHKRLRTPVINRVMRDSLLYCSDFSWERVSPAVFGSLFQGVMDDRERRQKGAHYTSERDIMKVVRSLFLNELRGEFNQIKGDRSTRRRANLEAFHLKLRKLKFFDPACGCGNFLVLTYRELRLLEIEVLKALYGKVQQELDVRNLCQVDVDQFYGIEILEWPVRIAEVAMWLMDHQMNLLAAAAFGRSFDRLPLRTSPHVVQGNALRMDWSALLPRKDCNYVLGNPPFVGYYLQTDEQKADLACAGGNAAGIGVLDYVAGWYFKAGSYCHGTPIRCAFVSTNSISQGEQPGILWRELTKRWQIKIHFAHRTFPWQSEARGKAHVHVVIIGFGAMDVSPKYITDYDSHLDTPTCTEVNNINPYLIEGSFLTLTSRSNPICEVPPCTKGSSPTDDGELIIEAADRHAFLRSNPGAKPYVRKLLCAEEYLHGAERYCLWLLTAPPGVVAENPEVKQRLEKVREFRLKSAKEPTRRKAATPGLFAEIRQPRSHYLVIPRHSSEKRTYVPLGYFGPSVIVHDSCIAVPDATLYHFGVLSSMMHMAWMKQVCGRLESRYRYSNKIVYNNYPWPDPITTNQREAVAEAAQAVLDVRAQFSTATLADLYDPLCMPGVLVKAHARLDRIVDRCYRKEPFSSDRERVEFLFKLYEKLTAPLVAAASAKAKKR